jgi:hypothetical protein
MSMLILVTMYTFATTQEAACAGNTMIADQCCSAKKQCESQKNRVVTYAASSCISV